MWAALPEVLAPLAAGPEVRTLVVTDAGPSFCAGADISDLLGGGVEIAACCDLRFTDPTGVFVVTPETVSWRDAPQDDPGDTP